MPKFAKTGGTSRIRFVMVDAEIAEGDVGSITQAIQNALRGPAVTAIQRIASTPKAAEAEASDAGASQPEPEIDSEGAEIVDTTPEAARPRTPRRPAKSPKVVPLDMKEGTSLESFAQGKDSGSHHKRFLIAAAWLKEHRGIEAFGADHMYTCYLSMGWPTNMPDFAAPLRELKGRNFFEQVSRGMYSINHIGLDYAKKLGNGGG